MNSSRTSLRLKVVGLLCIAGYALLGCAANKSYAPASYPDIGVVVSAGVGDELLTQGTAQLLPVLIVAEDAPIDEFTIKQGRYLAHRENSERTTFGPMLDNGKKVVIVLKKSDRTICVYESHCGKIKYSLGRQIVGKTKNSFQQTLIYNGKVGERILLGYREFSNDFARPAFSNNVEYDLKSSNVIGYRGARLEVVEATNVGITYKVLAGFN